MTELNDLNRIRLERDLTYEALAQQVGLQRTTLLRLLTTTGPRMHDRTLFKIRRFLQAQQQELSA